jgi:serine/threonine protein phosphatase 1
MRTYAIGDVHGHLDKLRAAHRLIRADRARTGDETAPVVHLGDLVDRGPASAEVIDYIRRGPVSGGPWLALKGNHDFMFALFLNDPDAHDPGLRPGLDWLDPRLGGAATLESYGVTDAALRPRAEVHAEARARVPAMHRDWIAGLPLIHCRGAAAFVHAGVRPGVTLAAQDATDLMWIRKPFLEHKGDFGALILHGHTPEEFVTHHGNRVAVDTGAAYGGPVSAVVIEGTEVFLLTPEGRAMVRPSPGLSPIS